MSIVVISCCISNYIVIVFGIFVDLIKYQNNHHHNTRQIIWQGS